MDDATRIELDALANSWGETARRKFASAARQKTKFGTRFVEHGAVCYANCAVALKRLIGADVSFPASTTPKELKMPPSPPAQ